MRGMQHGDKIVYSPRTGKLLFGRGDISSLNFDKPMDFIGVKTLGSLKQVPKTFSAKIDGIQSAPGLIKYNEYETTYSASSKIELAQMAARKELQEAIHTRKLTEEQLRELITLEAREKESGLIHICA